MVELPSSARRSLRQEQAQSTHPDASLLTAFAEQALTRNLRSQVMEHLADCSSCRTLVFLAKPETAPVLVPEKSFQWLPKFQFGFGYRWAAGLAALAVVASSALMLQTHVAIAPTSTPQTVAVATAPPVSPVIAQAQQQQVATPVNVVRAHSARIRPAAEVKPEVKDSAATEVASARTPTNVIAYPYTFNSREMFQTNVSLGPVQAPTTTVPAPAVKPADSNNKWMVSGPGLLYQSSDKGLSWQSVNVGKGVEFLAVAAIGQQVWAGGRAGTLYRSSDSGRTWTQITDSGIDGSDVSQIEFRDAQNGSITTARGIWATTDGGQTWQHQ